MDQLFLEFVWTHFGSVNGVYSSVEEHIHDDRAGVYVY